MDDNRSDVETRERIDEIFVQVNKRLKVLYRIMIATVLLLVFTVFASGYLINDNRHRSDRINKSRLTNMYNSCTELNDRNTNAKKALHDAIETSVDSGRITPTGGAASEKFTELLINMLAPRRDCNKLVLNPPEVTPETS